MVGSRVGSGGWVGWILRSGEWSPWAWGMGVRGMVRMEKERRLRAAALQGSRYAFDHDDSGGTDRGWASGACDAADSDGDGRAHDDGGGRGRLAREGEDG